MSSHKDPRSPASSPLPTESTDAKLTVEGRNPDGSMKLRVTVPGLIGDGSRRFTLARGPDVRPLQFDGTVVVEVDSPGSPDSHRAAIYKTLGGKFVTEFSSWHTPGILEYTRQQAGAPPGPRPPPDRGNAQVFESLEAALKWFRPGPLTTELLKKLDKWEPEFIE